MSEALGVSLDIRVENDPIEFERTGVDLRLTYDSRWFCRKVFLGVEMAEFWINLCGQAGKLFEQRRVV